MKQETREKISKSKIGKKRGRPSDETIEKIRQANIRTQTKKTKEEKLQQKLIQKQYWDKKSELERAFHGEKIRLGKIKKRRSAETNRLQDMHTR